MTRLILSQDTVDLEDGAYVNFKAPHLAANCFRLIPIPTLEKVFSENESYFQKLFDAIIAKSINDM